MGRLVKFKIFIILIMVLNQVQSQSQHITHSIQLGEFQNSVLLSDLFDKIWLFIKSSG